MLEIDRLRATTLEQPAQLTRQLSQTNEASSPEGLGLEHISRTAQLSPAQIVTQVCQIHIQDSSSETKSKVLVCFDPGTWATGGTRHLFCEIRSAQPPTPPPSSMKVKGS